MNYGMVPGMEGMQHCLFYDTVLGIFSYMPKKSAIKGNSIYGMKNRHNLN